MSLYEEYLKEINTREANGLHPKPIEDGELLSEIIEQIKDKNNKHRDASIDFFIYNTLPGTTSAAANKAKFLKEIILGDATVEKITPSFAFELLSHMKGGASIEVLLDLAFGDDDNIAKQAAKVVKTQVFLYEADTERIKKAYLSGNKVAKEILDSYANAEFFTNLPDIDEKIKVVTFVAAEAIFQLIFFRPAIKLIPEQTESFTAKASSQRRHKKRSESYKHSIQTNV